MIITKRHLSRRTVLKGLGVDRRPAVPRRDDAGGDRARRNTAAAAKVRFVAIEMVHGAAGSTAYGVEEQPLVARGRPGARFDLAPTSLAPLEPLRDYMTIVSNTDVRMAEAFTTPEIGGDHFRASSVFLTQAHPKQTMGSDLLCRDVVRSDLRAAVRAGHGDSVDAALHRGGRSLGRLRVQLLVRLHRRDQLGVAERAAADAARPARGVRRAVRRRRDARGSRPPPPRRQERARHHRRVDRSPEAAASAPPTAPGSVDYLDDVREIERRIQNVEAAEPQRRAARAADGAGRRARFVRRARQADVRPAGGRAGVGDHARVRVQAVARRLGPRLPVRPASPPASTTRRITTSGRSAFSTSRRSTPITSAWCRTSSSG